MAAELIIAPEAQQDVDEAYCWYEDRRPGLGEEFLGCVDACIQAICRMPESDHVFRSVIAKPQSTEFTEDDFKIFSVVSVTCGEILRHPLYECMICQG